mmetsp:Transcript_23862/g.31961  ORF Transcript_23862/g.31961 Transcript_23862/m.31961 type:complete len:203 (-) Transcript_23862:724-1332(-)|eukprot:CAMPEP_0185599986 /NCGR_PEP_ID=MMETSP0434-20130131/83084_1 /TAXON_ID=626734 ORGANISM="Favella taraikaensis, Strain Fe Narragansett Bay" /NCGR_SAMPLE_ID=MMETSP0434 /ASSEMBLY_ACC=CAM_ASM_000379 /LENGTH=202 /DNA_ID=CAMNT_0028229601 /DNA_START=2795 /DNA_END=3403 /DNA_ORIENTATION=+
MRAAATWLCASNVFKNGQLDGQALCEGLGEIWYHKRLEYNWNRRIMFYRLALITVIGYAPNLLEEHPFIFGVTFTTNFVNDEIKYYFVREFYNCMDYERDAHIQAIQSLFFAQIAHRLYQCQPEGPPSLGPLVEALRKHKFLDSVLSAEEWAQFDASGASDRSQIGGVRRLAACKILQLMKELEMQRFMFKPDPYPQMERLH